MLSLWENIELPLDRPVLIACPGPGALEGIARIPDNAYIIACNYGVCLPLPHVDEWMVMDEAAPKSAWWESAVQAAVRRDASWVWSEDLWQRFSGFAPAPEFLTSQGSALSYLDPFPQFGTLRTNATVAGAALQRAYWGGARDVYLLGVDMAGSGYFDGSGGVYNRPHNWPYVTSINALVAVLYAAGMQIAALSPTALDVEVLDAAV